VSNHATGDIDVERIVAKRGSFHVARIAAFILRGGDEWKIGRTTLQEQMEDLKAYSSKIDALLEEAFQILLKIIADSDFSSDPDRALKSASLDRDIDRFLYRNKVATA
jgi:hypothetical protein